MNTKNKEDAGGHRTPPAVACRRHAQPPRRRPRRAGARQRQRTRRPLRSRARGTGRGHPAERDRSVRPRRVRCRRCSPRSTPSLRASPRLRSISAPGSPTSSPASRRAQLAYGASAAALAIVLQAGLIAGVLVKEHKTAAQLASHTQQVDTGSYILIGFNPQASFADVSRFLTENKAPGRWAGLRQRFVQGPRVRNGPAARATGCARQQDAVGPGDPADAALTQGVPQKWPPCRAKFGV